LLLCIRSAHLQIFKFLTFSFPEPTICSVSGGIVGLWYQPLSPLPDLLPRVHWLFGQRVVLASATDRELWQGLKTGSPRITEFRLSAQPQKFETITVTIILVPKAYDLFCQRWDRRALGSVSRKSRNFSGPKLYFKIKIYRRVA